MFFLILLRWLSSITYLFVIFSYTGGRPISRDSLLNVWFTCCNINMVHKYISVRIKIYDWRWASFCLIVCSFFLLFVMLKSKRSLLVLLLYSILCSFSWVKRGRNLFITSIDSGSLMFLFVLFILDLTTSHLLVHHWH